MAKKPNVEVSVNGKKLDLDMVAIASIVAKRHYQINGATLKDDFCNYSIEVLDGQLQGETGTVNGPLIVSDDLRKAFQRLRVHLAVMDDAFLILDMQNIDEERESDTTDKYDVTGFKIKGADENIQVSLIGSKYLSTLSGRMECKTPYVLLDAGTTYQWYNELLEDIQNLRREVSYYKEGKGMRPEQPEEPVKKAKQTKITDKDQQESTEETAE